jgi:hypothetical protein
MNTLALCTYPHVQLSTSAAIHNHMKRKYHRDFLRSVQILLNIGLGASGQFLSKERGKEWGMHKERKRDKHRAPRGGQNGTTEFRPFERNAAEVGFESRETPEETELKERDRKRTEAEYELLPDLERAPQVKIHSCLIAYFTPLRHPASRQDRKFWPRLKDSQARIAGENRRQDSQETQKERAEESGAGIHTMPGLACLLKFGKWRFSVSKLLSL